MSLYEKGDRFEAKRSRDAGKVIEIREVLPLGRYLVQTEVHPKNPTAVGRTVNIGGHTLFREYRKISR